MKCTCHERDSSYRCPACHAEGCFGHMEKHLEIKYRIKELIDEIGQEIKQSFHIDDSLLSLQEDLRITLFNYDRRYNDED
jgi:hypothetical protein